MSSRDFCRFCLCLQPVVHVLRHITPVADGPNDKARAANDIADCKHSVEVGHLRCMVDANGAPAGDVQVGRAEKDGQIFGLKTQCSDDKIGI